MVLLIIEFTRTEGVASHDPSVSTDKIEKLGFVTRHVVASIQKRSASSSLPFLGTLISLLNL